jgi:hypothetical protein
MSKTKRIVCIFFSAMLVMLNATTAFASANNATNNNTSMQTELNNNLVTLLAKNGIKASISGNQVFLDDLSDINKANDIVAHNTKKRLNTTLGYSAKTSYPTPYYGPFAEYYNNEKFKKAGKTALAATVSAWATGVKVPKALAATFVSTYISYWFIESDSVNIYTSVLYYYSELGPGTFGTYGNFIGDYRIKKVTRITNNSDYTGGKTKTEYMNDSQLTQF